MMLFDWLVQLHENNHQVKITIRKQKKTEI